MSRVYIGRLPNRAQERDLERFFRGFGRIRDIMLKNGFAFVEFDDDRDAEDAVYEMNGKVLCGERVIVEHAKGTPRGEDLRRDLNRGYPIPARRSTRDRYDRYSGGRGDRRDRDRSGLGSGPPVRTNYRLIVKNLSSRATWQDLKDLFRKAGEVMYTDANTERSREGIVEFSSYKEVKRAIEKLDGYELHGRKMELTDDTAEKYRTIKRSRSRSPSDDSPSRSRKHDSGRRRGSSNSHSRSRSRSHDRRRRVPRDNEDSRSRSPSKKRARSRTRSPSKGKSRSPSHDKRSKSHSRTPDKRNDRSKSQSKSRSPSHGDEKKERNENNESERSRSRSPTKGSINGSVDRGSDGHRSDEDD